MSEIDEVTKVKLLTARSLFWGFTKLSKISEVTGLDVRKIQAYAYHTHNWEGEECASWEIQREDEINEHTMRQERARAAFQAHRIVTTALDLIDNQTQAHALQKGKDGKPKLLKPADMKRIVEAAIRADQLARTINGVALGGPIFGVRKLDESGVSKPVDVLDVEHQNLDYPTIIKAIKGEPALMQLLISQGASDDEGTTGDGERGVQSGELGDEEGFGSPPGETERAGSEAIDRRRKEKRDEILFDTEALGDSDNDGESNEASRDGDGGTFDSRVDEPSGTNEPGDPGFEEPGDFSSGDGDDPFEDEFS